MRRSRKVFHCSYEISLPMHIKRLATGEHLESSVFRPALSRGPLLYTAVALVLLPEPCTTVVGVSVLALVLVLHLARLRLSLPI